MKKQNLTTCKQNCRVIEDLNHHYHYFVSKISHEIRNPLTLVYSSLQLIEKSYPELPDSSLWGQVKQDVQDTIVLLNDLSTFNNSSVLRPSTFGLSGFLSSVAAACRPSVESHGIRFSPEVPEDLPSITADAVKLRQALLNLIRNAQDALSEDCPAAGSDSLSGDYLIAGSGSSSGNCPAAGFPAEREPRKEILLSAKYCEPFIYLHVRDNGPGIPSEYLDTVFDPFVTHKSSGTGLGLSIVKGVAKCHGGTVAISTSTCPPVTYTDVCITLPVHHATFPASRGVS